MWGKFRPCRCGVSADSDLAGVQCVWVQTLQVWDRVGSDLVGVGWDRFRPFWQGQVQTLLVWDMVGSDLAGVGSDLADMGWQWVQTLQIWGG